MGLASKAKSFCILIAMYANDGSRAFVVRVAGSRNEKSNLYVKGRSETPARSHRRTEQRDIATVQCRFRRARQLSAMLRTQTCQNKTEIHLKCAPVHARRTSTRGWCANWSAETILTRKQWTGT